MPATRRPSRRRRVDRRSPHAPAARASPPWWCTRSCSSTCPRRRGRGSREAIHAAGDRASGASPLAWLRMEPAGERAELRLTTWPGARSACSPPPATTAAPSGGATPAGPDRRHQPMAAPDRARGSAAPASIPSGARTITWACPRLAPGGARSTRWPRVGQPRLPRRRCVPLDRGRRVVVAPTRRSRRRRAPNGASGWPCPVTGRRGGAGRGAAARPAAGCRRPSCRRTACSAPSRVTSAGASVCGGRRPGASSAGWPASRLKPMPRLWRNTPVPGTTRWQPQPGGVRLDERHAHARRRRRRRGRWCRRSRRRRADGAARSGSMAARRGSKRSGCEEGLRRRRARGAPRAGRSPPGAPPRRGGAPTPASSGSVGRSRPSAIQAAGEGEVALRRRRDRPHLVAPRGRGGAVRPTSASGTARSSGV